MIGVFPTRGRAVPRLLHKPGASTDLILHACDLLGSHSSNLLDPDSHKLKISDLFLHACDPLGSHSCNLLDPTVSELKLHMAFN